MLYTEKTLFFGFEQVTELAGTSLPECTKVFENVKQAKNALINQICVKIYMINGIIMSHFIFSFKYKQ